MEYDLHSNTKVALGLAVQDITTDTTTVGAIIDTKGFESLIWAILSGTITDGTYALLLEEGEASNLSDATVLAAADTLGALTGFVAADDDEIRRIGSIGKKRFQRLSIVSASTTTGGTNFAATAILSDPKSAPVAVQDA